MEIVGLLIVFILALVGLAKISKLERDVARLSAMLPKAQTAQVIAATAEIAPAPEPVPPVETAPGPVPEVLPSAYETIATVPAPPGCVTRRR